MLAFIVFLLISGPSQDVAAPRISLGAKHATLQFHRPQLNRTLRVDENMRDSTCYTVRSYRFHRQDGQAPELAGVTTCTPANTLRQRQVSPGPIKLEPLNFAPGEK